MLTRTVRAETMLEALELIKNEMGSDALIVSARQVSGGPSWQVWKKTMVEVVAVKPDKTEKPENLSAAAPSQPKKEEPRSKKKAEPAAGKSKSKTAQPVVKPTVKPAAPSARIPAPAPIPVMPVMEKSLDELIEDTSPVRVNVKKAVFPELKKEKPAPRAASVVQEQKPITKPVNAPVDLMERLGILDAEAETRPEIDMTFTQTFQPESNLALEVIESDAVPRAEEARPVLSIEKFADLIAPKGPAQSEDMWPLLEKLYQQLKSQGLEEELLNRVTEVCLEMISSKGMNDERRIRETLAHQLEAYVHIQKESGGSAQQVICLVGVSGAGKTSLCAKLAVRYHNSLKKRVAWVSTDTVRTGAINEARTYADAIGVPLHTAYTPEELYEAVAREKIADVILVDMPAVNPRSEASVVELGSFLTVMQRRQTWIVAPATAKTSDLVNLAATLSPFRPKAIALTKLDETNTFGSAFNLAYKTQLPLVYYTFGPRVLDELCSARPDTLVRAMFTERFDG
jgi:flagellar biosynthesis protein FlhF